MKELLSLGFSLAFLGCAIGFSLFFTGAVTTLSQVWFWHIVTIFGGLFG